MAGRYEDDSEQDLESLGAEPLKESVLAVLQCRGCCRRRRKHARSIVSTSLKPIDERASWKETRQETRRLLDTDGGESEDERFFDARSEAGSACCTPRLPDAGGLYPPCAPSAPSSAAYHWRKMEAQKRLGSLQSIERRCRQGPSGSDAPMGDLQVERIVMEEDVQLYFCRSKSCPFVIGCLCCKLPGVGVPDALYAIQNPEQRMEWDGESFSSFEVLQAHDASDPTREDVVFTVIPAPRPILHREILQRRWQLPLGEDGQALLMQSFQDDTIMPANPKRVRAFTHLSGYLIRPVRPRQTAHHRRGNSCKATAGPPDTDVEVIVISQLDFGGSLPGWFQNLARRLAKKRCTEWGRKLRSHCQSQRRSSV